MANARSNGRLPKFEKVMVVSAHPDDPDFGAGGSIARLADSGAEVTYVIVTDGRQGGGAPRKKNPSLAATARGGKGPRPRAGAESPADFPASRAANLRPNRRLRRAS